MAVYPKLILAAILFSLLSFLGYKAYNHVYQTGYDAKTLEYQRAYEKAVEEIRAATAGETKAAAKVEQAVSKSEGYTKGLLDRVKELPKLPVVITEDPVNAVKTIRVYGLSDPAVRLFNDAVRGFPDTSEVQRDAEKALQR